MVPASPLLAALPSDHFFLHTATLLALALPGTASKASQGKQKCKHLILLLFFFVSHGGLLNRFARAFVSKISLFHQKHFGVILGGTVVN